MTMNEEYYKKELGLIINTLCNAIANFGIKDLKVTAYSNEGHRFLIKVHDDTKR